MSSVAEIENALKDLPLPEAQKVAQWLQQYVEQQGREVHTPARLAPATRPDYAARRRRILGEKVLPNMVLLGREQERG